MGPIVACLVPPIAARYRTGLRDNAQWGITGQINHFFCHHVLLRRYDTSDTERRGQFRLTTDDHGLSATVSGESTDLRRQYQTLSSVLNTFLSHSVDRNGVRLSGREIFSSALRQMTTEDGSLALIQDFLEALEQMGADFKASPDEGVSEEFLDRLERVDVGTLPETADCPICTNKFKDNDYPLIVKLPCHVQNASKKEHIFDMDCIAPWLKMNATCPLCRFNVHDADKIRRQRLDEELRLAREADEQDEEDDWELYG